jgi:hypothetical protein
MNKRLLILFVTLVSSAWCFPLIAQTGQPAVPDGKVPPSPQFEEETILKTAPTGFQIEERRYENRLDSVTVERENSGVRDHFNFNDPDVERRAGGIAEGSAMRTWRLGGGN